LGGDRGGRLRQGVAARARQDECTRSGGEVGLHACAGGQCMHAQQRIHAHLLTGWVALKVMLVADWVRPRQQVVHVRHNRAVAGSCAHTGTRNHESWKTRRKCMKRGRSLADLEREGRKDAAQEGWLCCLFAGPAPVRHLSCGV